MKLSEYAKNNNITYRTAWTHFKLGLIPNTKQLKSGTILVLDDIVEPIQNNKVVLYARVSTPKQKPDLENQKQRLIQYCISKGYQIKDVYTEIASGLNENRKELNKILNNDDFSILIVEHKDRLTRFGFNYIEKILNNKNQKIEIINIPVDEKEDIIQDLISIITCFCAKIYSRRKTKFIKESFKENTNVSL